MVHIVPFMVVPFTAVLFMIVACMIVQVEWYTSRPARTHTVFDDKVHSITFLER